MQKKRLRSVTIISEVKESEKICSYAIVAAAKPAKSPECPWKKVYYGNQKQNKTKLPPTDITE